MNKRQAQHQAKEAMWLYHTHAIKVPGFSVQGQAGYTFVIEGWVIIFNENRRMVRTHTPMRHD